MSHPKRKQPAAIALAERAISDLRAIEEYSVERWGNKVADRYFEEIVAALDRLSDAPGLLREEPALASGLHFYRVRKHVLVCDSRDATIIVLAVIHSAMDLPARLAELEPRLISEAEILHEKLRRLPQ